MAETRFETGFVLGKFCPLHKGHEYLIDYARRRVNRLYVVVDNIMDDVLAVKRRISWVRSAFPEAIVMTQPHPLPQDPSETPEFWTIWRECLLSMLPEKIDAVFASETYGERLAFELGARFFPVDLRRATIPISATDIRNNLAGKWDFLSDAAKSDMCTKICIVGPESTGKSTLTAQLAQYYDASVVEEYAKKIIVDNGGVITFEDMSNVLSGHQKAIETALEFPRPYLFVDTDAIMSKIWSRELFDQNLPQVDDFIGRQNFDLYLLMDVDIQWENDIHRFRPDTRKQFFETCIRELQHYGRRYIVISGTGEERIRNAISGISKALRDFRNPL